MPELFAITRQLEAAAPDISSDELTAAQVAAEKEQHS
jgi:hypothetical protein